MKQLFTLLLLLFATTVATSQSWQQLGTSGAGGGYISMATDADDNLYMFYTESSGVIAKKFNGTDWEELGAISGTSSNSPFASGIEVDPSGTPYVAFMDASDNNTIKVRKFNGTEWESVGDDFEIAEGPPVFKFTLSASGTPYIAYSDAMNDNRATVAMFNGTEWETVGDALLSSTAAVVTCLDFNAAGVLYMVYAELGSTITTSVMKYNGSEWEYVGTPGFLEDMRIPTSMAFNMAGEPYIGCIDAMEGVATFLKFNGTSWQDIIVEGLAISGTTLNSIAFDSSDTLYTAVTDSATGDRALVKRFNGSAWENLGPPVSGEASVAATIIIDSEDNIYVSYTNNSEGAVAKKFCEECQPGTTQLAPAYCGITVSNLNDNLEATPLADAEKYQFRASDGVNTYIVTRNDNIFRVSLLPSYGYSKTYTVEVSVRINGEWGAFGPSCTVSTPDISTTQLKADNCDITISSFGTNLYADAVMLAEGYRFRITNGAEVQTIDKPSQYFRLNQLASYEYDTTYTIDVAVLYNGDYGDYGHACTVTTPEVPVTSLNAASCGTTVANFSTNLYATAVNLAQGYRFRVTNTNDMGVQVINGTASYFRLKQLVSYEYNTTYIVEVAVMIDGAYGAYGPPCTVTTPAPPVTQLRAQDCGITVAGFGTNLYADAVVLAEGYRFRVTNGATVNIVNWPTRNFRIKMLPSYSYNTTYTIEVAVMIDGVYGPYGPSCEVSTPSSGMRQNIANDDEDAVRNVTAYPNPFETSFAFALETESDEPITLQAYDITGKMLENRTVTPDDLISLKIGENYTTGIYSVIVTQGSYTKTVKMVKK